MKNNILGIGKEALTLSEVLTALSICAATSPVAKLAFSFVPQLKNCEAHSSNILSAADDNALRRLGINVTCENEFPSSALYFD